MTNKNSRFVKILSFVLTLTTILCIFTGCSNEPVADESEIINNNIDTRESYEISTDFGSVYFPAEWESIVDVETEVNKNHILKFTMNNKNDDIINVFDLIIGEGNDIFVGNVKFKDDIIKPVYIKFYDEPTELLSEDEIQQFYSMQEDVNYIIEKFEIVSETPEIAEYSESFIIETPYINLEYPGKWSENIFVEHIEGEECYTVEFYGIVGSHEKTHIFDVYFTTDDDSAIGTLNINGESVVFGVKIIDIEFDESWTEEEKSDLNSMTEDVNFIISNIMESKM